METNTATPAPNFGTNVDITVSPFEVEITRYPGGANFELVANTELGPLPLETPGIATADECQKVADACNDMGRRFNRHNGLCGINGDTANMWAKAAAGHVEWTRLTEFTS